MIASARAALVDVMPRFARIVGGFYPHLPVHLWEFDLQRNREALIVWRSSDATIRCEQKTGDWHVSVVSPDYEDDAEFEDFNKALSTAYQFICLASQESSLEPLDESVARE